MRITLVVPKLDGYSGGLRVAAQYARHLHDSGHELTILARNIKPILSHKQRLLRLLGLRRRRSRVPGPPAFFAGLDIPLQVLPSDRRVDLTEIPDADAVISTWWATAEWVGGFPATKGRHIHFIQDYEDFQPRLSRRVRAVYNQKNGKIAVAGWLRDCIRERHGQDCHLVPNGVETSRFSAAPRGLSARSQVGFLWSPHPRKNCALAIEALLRLRNLRPDLKVIVFGNPPRPDLLPDWFTYEHRPAQDQIVEIYASCDLWLFPTLSEGFGLPLLEAMACRTPVLAMPAGAAPDLIRHGQNGWLLPAEATPDDMAAAAHGILSVDDTGWRAVSEAAWQTAQEHDLSDAAQAFEAAVLRIAAG